jgi:hypothetical protein
MIPHVGDNLLAGGERNGGRFQCVFSALMPKEPKGLAFIGFFRPALKSCRFGAKKMRSPNVGGDELSGRYFVGAFGWVNRETPHGG